ncbi:hypothetical protein LshimejAT787_0805860 [Lyophyllum shimeji]|uniref:Uncharacterized protein n=1 Tax=Lyophyllum shimeji TaxID=47721 RepID=A0A9P3PRK4_LYOSH|nr:hypothetical protein LshimejAT787_0805860 [Lyophyllum shimeji]
MYVLYPIVPPALTAFQAGSGRSSREEYKGPSRLDLSRIVRAAGERFFWDSRYNVHLDLANCLLLCTAVERGVLALPGTIFLPNGQEGRLYYRGASGPVGTNNPDSTHKRQPPHTPLAMFQFTDPAPVNLCRLVTCDKCKKTTWAGCGQHVESVMKDVKEEDRCVCPR